MFIGQLRQKLEANPAEPRLILTEAGVGYRLDPETNDRRRSLPEPPNFTIFSSMGRSMRTRSFNISRRRQGVGQLRDTLQDRRAATSSVGDVSASIETERLRG